LVIKGAMLVYSTLQPLQLITRA